ncbi:MAG: type VI secretion system tip protein VgrG [Azoarcus sp.]|jgi:type VI secretion system secreted protein VgrG|nr:type VI secretion system tip protein VgrG [Azoarcus sp.]
MNRMLVAHTPLKEVWSAVSLHTSETLSSLYEFRLELKSKRNDIDIQSVIGEAVSVECNVNFSPVRYFSGLVINSMAKGKSGKYWLYELRVAPKVWFASRRADFKIFQNRTVQDIVDEVLQQNAISCEWRLKNSYKTWEYIVQYGETDLAFIQRLLGFEGIYFWFEHGKNGEKLILGDHFSVHEPFSGFETIPYYPQDASRVDEDHFNAWYASRAAEPGRFVQTSYDFKSPSKDLTTESVDPRGHLFDQYEIFSYPGAYTEPEHGQDYAAARLQGLQGDQDLIMLEGPVRGAIPGCIFKLDKHPVERLNREYMIVTAEYHAWNNDYEAGGIAQAEDIGVSVKVSAMPADRQYRTPANKFRMPRALGPDTAVVVGPGEIHNDKYGRIKVHFHWDRYGKKDGSDSCWIRVASPWAGGSVGTLSIPRVGQEVVVEYEHGDPQRPLVTGCVYNAEQMPPWDLPAGKTRSGFMSRSTPGGGPNNFSGMRFENAKGRELFAMQAERDLWLHVKNDANFRIGGNLTGTVVGKRDVTLGKGDKLTVDDGGRDVTITAGGDKLLVTAGGRKDTITGGGDKLIVTDGGRAVTIAEGGDKLSVTNGGRETTIFSGDKLSVFDGRETFILSGGDKLVVNNGRKVIIAGDENITINGNRNDTIIGHLEQKLGSALITSTGRYKVISSDWWDTKGSAGEAIGFNLSFKGAEVSGMGFEIAARAIQIQPFGYSLSWGILASENTPMRLTSCGFETKNALLFLIV